MTAPASPSHPPEYITRKELCKRLNISPSTVYRHALQDFAIAIGGAIRYDWNAIIRAYGMQADERGDK